MAFSIWGSFALVLKPIHTYASLDILFYRVFSCAVIMSIISILFKRQKIKENIQLFQSLPKAKKQSIDMSCTIDHFDFCFVFGKSQIGSDQQT